MLEAMHEVEQKAVSHTRPDFSVGALMTNHEAIGKSATDASSKALPKGNVLSDGSLDFGGHSGSGAGSLKGDLQLASARWVDDDASGQSVYLNCPSDSGSCYNN